MADIARRADISAPAIYNHYEGKAQLLVAAGKWALERITTRRDRQVDPEAIVRAFLAPGFADTRRLLVELHLAGQRHPDVAELLAAWHRKNTLAWLPFAGGDDPKATVTTFFAFLLGLCQIDSLLGAEADRQAVVEAAVATLSVLFPEGVRP
jgi:AcrR family transcriptional regulator